MAFFKKLLGKKERDNGKKGEKRPKVKKTFKASAPQIPEAELKRAKEMAFELANNRKFAEFCKNRNLGSPGSSFLRFYAEVSQNQALWKIEAEAEEKAEGSGKPFNRTVFYGNVFIKCGGKPENLIRLIYKG